MTATNSPTRRLEIRTARIMPKAMLNMMIPINLPTLFNRLTRSLRFSTFYDMQFSGSGFLLIQIPSDGNAASLAASLSIMGSGLVVNRSTRSGIISMSLVTLS